MKKARGLVIKAGLLFVVLALCLVDGVQAAGFDCTKATTKTEKTICADPELSKLDEEMGKIYSQALEKFVVPEALKLRQKQWLKRRDVCVEEVTPKYIIQCLKESYQLRLEEIASLVKADLPCPELPLIKREEEKAKCLQRWLAKHPMEPRRVNSPEKDMQFCSEFFQALATASPEIGYVEPVLRTENPQHPDLAKYRKCYDYEPVGLDYDYDGIDEQAHGFRLYRVDLDGNSENGLEEYLYSEESWAERRTHYVRVAFGSDRCDTKDVAPTTQQEARRSGSAGEGLNSIVSFRGRYYIFDLSGDVELRIIGYDSNRQKFSAYLCNWHIPEYLLNNQNNEKGIKP